MSMFLIANTSAYNCYAQAIGLSKSLFDSLKTERLYLNASAGIGVEKVEISVIKIGADFNQLYYSKQHAFETIGIFRYNALDRNPYNNQGFGMFRAKLFNHTLNDKKQMKLNDIYPEPFIFYQFDQERGLEKRLQLGISAAYNIIAGSNFKMNMGVGILREWENWRVLSEEFYPGYDTLTDQDKSTIRTLTGIDEKGEYQYAAMKANLYIHISTYPTKNTSLHCYVKCQQPLNSAFSPVQVSSFFVDYKEFRPRFLMDLQFKISITRYTEFFTRYILMHDRGQLASFVPYYTYSFNQGFSFNF